jgi:hypothetical protein
MSDKKFHSGFTRIPVNDDGGKAIKQLQEDFDKFWRKINRLSDKRTEKYYALKSMQEACMWMTRAVALQNEKVPEIIIDDPLNVASTGFNNPLKVSDVFDKLPTMKPGETIFHNGMRMVVKKPRK